MTVRWHGFGAWLVESNTAAHTLNVLRGGVKCDPTIASLSATHLFTRLIREITVHKLLHAFDTASKVIADAGTVCIEPAIAVLSAGLNNGRLIRVVIGRTQKLRHHNVQSTADVGTVYKGTNYNFANWTQCLSMRHTYLVETVEKSY